jgi:hypothetical protein
LSPNVSKNPQVPGDGTATQKPEGVGVKSRVEFFEGNQ